MDKYDVELLEECKVNPTWWHSFDRILSVASILADEGCFGSGSAAVKNCIYYFEKPWKWNTDIKQLLEDYHDEIVTKELNRCEDKVYAVEWIVEYLQDVVGKSNLETLAYKFAGILL
jgi:hypothetical protein